MQDLLSVLAAHCCSSKSAAESMSSIPCSKKVAFPLVGHENVFHGLTTVHLRQRQPWHCCQCQLYAVGGDRPYLVFFLARHNTYFVQVHCCYCIHCLHVLSFQFCFHLPKVLADGLQLICAMRQVIVYTCIRGPQSLPAVLQLDSTGRQQTVSEQMLCTMHCAQHIKYCS